jgi:hypothetical protein
MDKLKTYRDAIQALLEAHCENPVGQADIETQILIDPVRDHYQLMRVGWNGLHRAYYVILHFDIKNGKVWIQQNTTDSDVAQELIEKGISQGDIVLGLQPPYKRPLTGFAVA